LASVELKNITKRFGEEAAVDDVSFSVAKGALVALLGPSGCGKSTTLRLIAGLDTETSGAIHIAGEDVTGKPPAGRGVSMVFQSYALFPHLSVAENIVFGLRVRKVGAAELKRRLDRVSELLGLQKLLQRKPSQLSGGQQQRVALGRAIVAETPVCLMDEPLSNLDAQLRAEMRREIRALQQRLGITMIYVTHDQVEAMTMADQVVLMRAGKIEQDGPPAALYEQPQSIFVARFVGTPPMNVVPLADVADAAPWLASAAPRSDGALAAGIRPEAIRFTPHGIPVAVAAREYLGADSLVEVRAKAHSLIARTIGRGPVETGASAHISWDPAVTHWFDLSSGRRIA
jgi:sn-glycerol 3-phosphate transport system ATP-binding protein